MAQSSPLSPPYLSPVPSSVPLPQLRGRSREKDIDELALSSLSATMPRALSPSSLKEAEIETSIYFPTFAHRRQSSPHVDLKNSFKSSLYHRISPTGIPSRRPSNRYMNGRGGGEGDEEEDDIFALDDDMQEELMDEIDGDQLTSDIPSIDLDQMTFSSSSTSRRRPSDQTNSSISEQDLLMVWEEEDNDEEENDQDDTVIIRKNSRSSSSASRGLIRRESLLTSRKMTLKATQVSPSLPYAPQRVEGGLGEVMDMSPPLMNHWQRRRKVSSTALTPRRSSTVSYYQDNQSINRSASLERYHNQIREESIILSSPSTSAKIIMAGIRSYTYPHLKASQQSSNSDRSSNPSTILFNGGRKRSATDPLAVHPPFLQKKIGFHPTHQ